MLRRLLYAVSDLLIDAARTVGGAGVYVTVGSPSVRLCVQSVDINNGGFAALRPDLAGDIHR